MSRLSSPSFAASVLLLFCFSCLLLHLCLVFNLKMSSCLSHYDPKGTLCPRSPPHLMPNLVSNKNILPVRSSFADFHISDGWSWRWISPRSLTRSISNSGNSIMIHKLILNWPRLICRMSLCMFRGYLRSLYLWSFFRTFCKLFCGFGQLFPCPSCVFMLIFFVALCAKCTVFLKDVKVYFNFLIELNMLMSEWDSWFLTLILTSHHTAAQWKLRQEFRAFTDRYSNLVHLKYLRCWLSRTTWNARRIYQSVCFWKMRWDLLLKRRFNRPSDAGCAASAYVLRIEFISNKVGLMQPCFNHF